MISSLSLSVEQIQQLQMVLVQSDIQTLWYYHMCGRYIWIISLTLCNITSRFNPSSKKRSISCIKSLWDLFIGWLSQNLLEGIRRGSMQRRKSMKRVGVEPQVLLRSCSLEGRLGLRKIMSWGCGFNSHPVHLFLLQLVPKELAFLLLISINNSYLMDMLS